MNVNIKSPKGETIWVVYCDKDDNPQYIVTSKPEREFYFLYEVAQGGTLKKLGKARTPPELEKKYIYK